MAGFVAHPGETPHSRPHVPDVAPRPSSGNWALLAAILGSSMIFIDGTAVNVALPVLQRDLGASSSSVQWVVEGYALLLSALILIGGSLGDRYGRRVIFGAGIAAFTLASLVCAVARNIDVLVIARCLQGIGGALATPGSLALISASFTGTARGRAIGTWSAFSVIISALGPVLGGWLVQAASWRWIFLLNVPIAAVVLIVLVRWVDESRDASAARQIDFVGATLATTGLGTLVFGLIRLQGSQFEGAAIACVLAGAALLAAFIRVERRIRAPMIELSLFAVRPFAIANLYTFFLYAALGGSMYFLPFDFIDVQGYSPALAGAALLPMTLIMFTLSRFTGGLVDRVGARIPLAIGAALAAAAFVAFANVGVGRSYWVSVFPATVLLGLGAAAFVAPLTTLVMGAVENTHAGVASGINNAISRTAGLVAIALFGIALAAVFDGSMRHALVRGHVSATTRAAVEAQFARIVSGSPPARIDDPRERAVVAGATRDAYARGFALVMFAAAALSVVAAILALDPSLRVARTPSAARPDARKVEQ